MTQSPEDISRVAEALARFKAGRDGDSVVIKANQREAAMKRLLELGAEAGITRSQIEAMK